LGLLILIFYFACAPKSKAVTVQTGPTAVSVTGDSKLKVVDTNNTTYIANNPGTAQIYIVESSTDVFIYTLGTDKGSINFQISRFINTNGE
jgi:hypothetical protein